MLADGTKARPGKKELESETGAEIQIESLTNSRSQLDEKAAATIPPSSPPAKKKKTDSK